MKIYLLLQKRYMNKFSLLFLSVLFVACKQPSPDKFIDDLMSRMSVEEKIGQLHLISGTDAISGENLYSDSNKTVMEIRKGKVGAFINAKGVNKIRELQRIAVEESRMKIPLLFGMDFLHGYETIFPIPLGMASSWNLKNIETAAHIAAVEASADGLNWVYSPMVDIARDPRWGRIAEGAGEDPFLGGEIAKAQVRGYQGEPAYADNTNILACVKHFALYGASEAGRDYSVVDMSEQRARNDYLYPYQAAIEAGVGSVMSSFNEINGMPATANSWLLDDVLRKEWGFQGFVVTDYASINDIQRFGMGNSYGAAIMSLKAGTDMDMESYAYYFNLQKALSNGDINIRHIDDACRRILKIKYKLGLFKDPYKYCDTTRPARDIYNAKHRETARKIATETFVLLKNDSNLLPLKKQSTIALIGPHGNNRPNMLGSWGWPANINKATTLLEGMKEYASVIYARGCQPYEDMTQEDYLSLTKDFEKDPRSEAELLREALSVAKKADVIVAALGESAEMSGESSSRSDLNIPAPQKRLLKALVATGKPVVLVLFTGRPLTILWEKDNVDAILNVWFPGTEAAFAIPDVLFGDVNPSGKLTATWSLNVGQIPIYYNIKNVSKPMQEWFHKFRSGYLDVPNEPLYPFGYGLSYTTFDYGEIAINDTVMSEKDTLVATVAITNSGDRDGYETVQLYIRDVVASTVRPVKELKGFEKVFIKKGETKNVSFKITSSLLKFYNYQLQYVCEQGEFELMIGRNSADTQTITFTLI
ncbi:MAG: beta-glucosidase BglX [Bacteroidales bacterium]|jgi:beta-glucosidase|nr:beta-glucosidase BglX [Bacteroidales bacterium]